LESIGSSQSSASTAASYSSTPKPVAKSTASSPASYLESIGSSQSSASTAASSSSTPSYLDAISSPGQVKASPAPKKVGAVPASYLENLSATKTSGFDLNEAGKKAAEEKSKLDTLKKAAEEAKIAAEKARIDAEKARLSSSSISTRNDMAKSTTMSGSSYLESLNAPANSETKSTLSSVQSTPTKTEGTVSEFMETLFPGETNDPGAIEDQRQASTLLVTGFLLLAFLLSFVIH